MVNIRLYVKDKHFEFICPPTTDVLTAARSKFAPLPSGCRRGGCGMCKVAVLEGKFSSKKVSKAALTDEEQKHNMALACRMYPITDLQLTVAHKSHMKS